jgi:hypothetical protein
MGFNDFIKEAVATGILMILVVTRIISKLVRRFARTTHRIEHRTIYYQIHAFVNHYFSHNCANYYLGCSNQRHYYCYLFHHNGCGVAMFAQWSILSNITSGIILFFFPFKIGDVIRIHDKDFPIEAEIEDIRAFHVALKTKDGESHLSK